MTTNEKPFIPTILGEYRNVYRRADGTLRYGPLWRDRETAENMKEVLLYEDFVETQNMRDTEEKK